MGHFMSIGSSNTRRKMSQSNWLCGLRQSKLQWFLRLPDPELTQFPASTKGLILKQGIALGHERLKLLIRRAPASNWRGWRLTSQLDAKRVGIRVILNTRFCAEQYRCLDIKAAFDAGGLVRKTRVSSKLEWRRPLSQIDWGISTSPRYAQLK